MPHLNEIGHVVQVILHADRQPWRKVVKCSPRLSSQAFTFWDILDKNKLNLHILDILFNGVFTFPSSMSTPKRYVIYGVFCCFVWVWNWRLSMWRKERKQCVSMCDNTVMRRILGYKRGKVTTGWSTLQNEDKFQGFMTLKFQGVVFWIVTPCRVVAGFHHLGESCCPHLQTDGGILQH